MLGETTPKRSIRVRNTLNSIVAALQPLDAETAITSSLERCLSVVIVMLNDWPAFRLVNSFIILPEKGYKIQRASFAVLSNVLAALIEERIIGIGYDRNTCRASTSSITVIPPL